MYVQPLKRRVGHWRHRCSYFTTLHRHLEVTRHLAFKMLFASRYGHEWAPLGSNSKMVVSVTTIYTRSFKECPAGLRAPANASNLENDAGMMHGCKYDWTCSVSSPHRTASANAGGRDAIPISSHRLTRCSYFQIQHRASHRVVVAARGDVMEQGGHLLKARYKHVSPLLAPSGVLGLIPDRDRMRSRRARSLRRLLLRFAPRISECDALTDARHICFQAHLKYHRTGVLRT
ncbi:uncharacterized protein C8Q71DRAFT_156150 [Rhodofomes roseus]|uniref:Uncharacterized protein n=1 Tax=Rhodofomes roseus TaxID=34475 RepID=A0ABQ8K9G3_9APHY|nr:uncharacterized protein C8Q71DRAFT_156150 [Rhodofomes roseus]KAH9834017.1 hypothetical protein C8Q71DRAFT_156150 [Rhodofomes roseus]